MSKTIYTQKQLKRSLSKKFAKVEADPSFPGVRVAGVDLGDSEEKRLVAQYIIVFKDICKVSSNNTTVFIAWKRGVATGTTKRALVTHNQANWEQRASFDLQLLQHRDGSFDKKMLQIELKEDVLVKKKGKTQWKVLGRGEIDLGKFAKSHSEQVIVELKKKRKKRMILRMEITAHWKKFDHHRFERVVSSTKLPKFADEEEEKKATRIIGNEKYLLHTDYSDISDVEVSEDDSTFFAPTDDEDTIDEDYIPKFAPSNPFDAGNSEGALKDTNPFGFPDGEKAPSALNQALKQAAAQPQGAIKLLDSLSSSSSEDDVKRPLGLSQDRAQAVLVKEAMMETEKKKRTNIFKQDNKNKVKKTVEAFPGIKTHSAKSSPFLGNDAEVDLLVRGSNPFEESSEQLVKTKFASVQTKEGPTETLNTSKVELKEALQREFGYQKLLDEYELKVQELKMVLAQRDSVIRELKGELEDAEGKNSPGFLAAKRRQNMSKLVEKCVYLSHPLFNKNEESISALVIFDQLMELGVFDQGEAECKSLLDLLLNAITLFCQVPTRRPKMIAYWITTTWQLFQKLKSGNLEGSVSNSLIQLVSMLLTRLFTSTIRRIEAQLLDALGAPFEPSMYFKAESLSFNTVVDTLQEVLDVLLSNHCSQFMIRWFFKLLISFVNRYLVNSVLNNPDICTFNNGMRIKMEVSFLCQWLLEGPQSVVASDCPDLLDQIKEVAQLLTMSKTRQSTEALGRLEALNARQMRRILKQYQSGPVDSGSPVSFDVVPASFSSTSRHLVEHMVTAGDVATDRVDPVLIRALESAHAAHIDYQDLEVADDLHEQIALLKTLLLQ